MTDYNWAQNAQNLAQDWYYESYPEPTGTPGKEADDFVSDSQSQGARPMLTIPLWDGSRSLATTVRSCQASRSRNTARSVT